MEILEYILKTGNEPQAGISGYNNFIHSAISSDGGRTWVIESGVRKCPVTNRSFGYW